MKEKIIIVWWGTTGWITALFLSKKLPSDFEITLISSDKIWTLWVWESTIPHIVTFLSDLWIEESEMMRACNATYKMWVKFTDWKWDGSSFLNPFSRWLTSKNYDGIPFAHYWFHGLSSLDYTKISDISHFTFQQGLWPKSHSWESLLEYAYHLDAHLLGEFLKQQAISNWVSHIEGKMENSFRNNTGNIEHIIVDGKKIYGNLFFDCSGFHSLLISQTDENKFHSYSDELFVDRALFCRIERKTDFVPPYTESTTMQYGWKWCIPLYDVNGNGYVYSSKHVSDKDAIQEFRSSLWLPDTQKIWKLQMKLGRYQSSWVYNSIWIWPSYWFIEPLEATGIYLTCRQLELFVSMFQQSDYRCGRETIDTYNKILAREFDAVKDFIVLHYAISGRWDSSFWEANKTSIWSSLSLLLENISDTFPNISFDTNLPSLFKYQSYTIILIGLWYYDDILEKLDIPEDQLWVVKKDVYNFLSTNKILLKKLKTHRQALDDIHS